MNGQNYEISATQNETIQSIIKKLEQKADISITTEKLIYEGNWVEVNKTLNHYGIEDGHVLHLMDKGRGGDRTPQSTHPKSNPGGDRLNESVGSDDITLCDLCKKYCILL